jgi:hypothetical protein
MSERAPDAFIIGAQKGGSTSLDRYLGVHPDVIASRGEVPALEDPDYGSGGVDGVRDWIAGQTPTPTQRIVLRRPNYLALPEIPQRMRATWPDIKLLVVLRDPAARAVSAYFHYMRHGQLPVRPVESGMAELLDRRGVLDGWPRSGEVLEFGDYGTSLQRWIAAFPVDRLLALDSTLLRVDPTSQLRRVAIHLGVEPGFEAPDIADGMPGSYGMRSVWLRHHLTPVLYSRSTGHRLRARGKLPQVFDRTERLLQRRRVPQPALSEGLTERLMARYATEVALLRTCLPDDQHPTWAERYEG